jgi:glycosyltransferase involved in cell wall biosynthesis
VATSPLVSVVIPTHNYGRFLPDAVASVRAQGVPGIEILVVDDASTDDTAAVLAGLAGPDLRALQSGGQGVSAARNLGIELARGRYLAFLDADDRWTPAKLQRQLELMESEPEVALVFTNFARFGPQGRYPRTQFDFIPGLAALPARPSRGGGGLVLEADTFESLVGLEQFPTWVQTVLLRRDAVADLRFPAGVAQNEDQHYMYRVYARVRAAWIADPLVEVRRHGENSYRSAAEKLVPDISALELLAREPFAPRHRHALRRRIGRAWAALGYHHFWHRSPLGAGRAYLRSLAYPGTRLGAATHLLALPLVPFLTPRPDVAPD